MARSRVLAIAGKELRENVLSRRFQIALVLSTLLMVTSVVVLAVNHKQDLEAFQVAQADLQQGQSFGGFNTISMEVADVLAKPNPLSVFVTGPGDEYRRSANPEEGAGIAFSQGDAQATGGSASPTSNTFPPLDLAFVAVAIMTLMAVLFAHDAISGERERGTLKLMLANPVPRDAILVGKYLGGMASILLPFAVSVLAAVATLQVVGVQLEGGQWLRLGLIVLLYIPLASAFYLVGLLVSSLTRRSGTSMLALLLVWLLLVFASGNVAGAAAKTAGAEDGDADLLREFQAIREDEQAQSAAVQDKLMPLMQGPGGNNMTRLQPYFDQLRAIGEEAQERRDAALAAARRQEEGRLRLAESLAMLSPAEAYRGIATALAGTDYWSFVAQRDAADLYLREVERARAEWNEENGGSGPFISIGPGAVSARPVGISGPGGFQDFEPPEFRYEPRSLSEQLASPQALQGLGVLLLSNVVAFGGAYLAFRRYDVR